MMMTNLNSKKIDCCWNYYWKRIDLNYWMMKTNWSWMRIQKMN
jgi:hypothetical protein